MRNPHDLLIYQRADPFALDVHHACERLPTRRAPGLRAQILEAADSIPSNIAEGCGRDTDRQLAHFISISIASANELESHLRRASALSLLNARKADRLIDELIQIRRMMIAFRKALLRRENDEGSSDE